MKGRKFMPTVGERIKIARQNLHMKQDQFAAELGISRTHLSGIENGKDNPSMPLIKLISFKYNINETWLMSGEDSPTPSYDIRTDEGKISKLNEAKFFTEKIIQNLSGNSLEYAVNTISNVSSLLLTEGISETGREKYLHTLSDLISAIEILKYNAYHLHSCKGKSIDFKTLYKYQTETEIRVKKIEKLLGEISTVFLREYGLLQNE